MEIRTERQASPVADPVEAKIAIMRPILASLLNSLNAEIFEDFDYAATNKPRGALPLRELGRLHSRGDGDVGLAFEYAIHDAVLTRQPAVLERVTDALKECRIRQGQTESIFFAVEKAGSEQLINTHMHLITDHSVVLSSPQEPPIPLKSHLADIASAFRKRSARTLLPQSIRGLWKADLLLGSLALDHWVGTTVKTNPRHLQGDAGLRIGIVPASSGRSDRIKRDSSKNLVICPIPHDESYMQIFYETWWIAMALMKTKFQMPREVDLPRPEDRYVARVFCDKSAFTIADALDATENQAQPHLLTTNSIMVRNDPINRTAPATAVIVVPQAMFGDDAPTPQNI
ncbi:hypothetical protein [Nonomuraea rhizosphaerae]|uniref:hypothetical protein n=1 Tax=Nonomuraea rhizosphaerae TaxID=2665663 RepID=UPI001C5D2C9C|nr:hypothetical protein [Nonomuraea rhizosphaerae]